MGIRVDIGNVKKSSGLKQNQNTDTKFYCDIDTIIENIMARLITYNQKYGNDMEEIILEESDN